MDNWPIFIAITLVLGGGIYLLSRPLPLDYKNGEYQRHLTKQEIAALHKGETIEKTHKAYQSIWKDYYDEGPLRVTPVPKGKYKYTFAAHGHWRRIRKDGTVWAEFTQSNLPQAVDWLEYLPNGQPDYRTVIVPRVLNGDSVLELRTIYFKLAAPTDTAYVEHRFAKLHENKDAGKSFFSFDANGKRPVPPSWQRTR
jgi:hypothetical protein